MLRGSNRREGTSTWRVRAISYPNRISRYLAGALHLKRFSRQNPDAQEEPQQVSVVATAMEVSRQVQPTSDAHRNRLLPSGVSTILLGQGLEARVGNDDEADVSRQEWPFNVRNTEVFVFGEIKLTRGQLNKCLQLTLDLISVIQTVNINQRLGAPYSAEHVLKVKSNVHELIETLLSFIDNPRDRRDVQIQLNNGNIFINSKRNYNVQCMKRNNLRGSALPFVRNPPSVPHAARVNRAQTSVGGSSGQGQPASPFFSVARFDRTKALQNAAGRQFHADVDGEAPDPRTREEASHEQGDISYEDDRFDVNLGTFNRQEMRRKKIKIRPNVGTTSTDEMRSFFEPRRGLTSIPLKKSCNVPAKTPTIREHLQKYHVAGNSIPTENNWCYGGRQNGVGEEMPRTKEPVKHHPEMGTVVKSVVAISPDQDSVLNKQSHIYDTVAPNSDSESFDMAVVNSVGSCGLDEVGPSGNGYQGATELDHAENGEDTDTDEYFCEVTEASRRKVKSWLEDSKNESDLLKKEPELAVKKLTPAKPMRSRSLSATAPSLGHHVARTRKKSLSSPKDEEKSSDPFRAKSSLPLPHRAAGFGHTFNAKHNRNTITSESKPTKAVQPIYDTLNEPGTGAVSSPPIRAASPYSARGSLPALPPKGVTRANLPLRPPPPPPPLPPRNTSPVRMHNNKCAHSIYRRKHRFFRRCDTPPSPPPPPPRTTASTTASTSTSTSTSASASASASASDIGSGSGQQLAARPGSGSLRNSDGVPNQQNITQQGETTLEWLWMDDNILLQHGTVPFPTTYKLPK